MATYYWIGGNGNWNDTAKWSLTSGGTTAGVVPGAADDVIFNAASDGAANANFTVTANAAGCAANSITVTPDRVITFDGGAGNLSANFWTQNASASTTGAILNNTISINSNVTVNRGVFTANGNLTIGNNFFANGFGTPATANRVVFTLANTMTTGTFTANASNWFWQNFNFSANSRLYLTGRNTAIFAMQSPNIAMTWGTNSAIVVNGAGISGETRTIYTSFLSAIVNGATATANLNPFALNITNGSDQINFSGGDIFYGGINFTGFSGTANLVSNLWIANGNLVLSPTMTLTSASSARSIRIGGWTGSNTGLITNGLSNASVGINFQGANINANMFVANNFDLLGNSIIAFNGGNVNLGNNIISAAQLVIGTANHGINFNTSGEIILTGSNATVFTGPTTSATVQNYQGNIKITSNYTGATGIRTFITGYSNLTINTTGSNGIFIGTTATDSIRILSNASNNFGSGSGRAMIDLRGMTNTLLNDKRAVRGGSFFPTADKMQAGSNVTAFTNGVIDSLGIIFPFPLQFGSGDVAAVTISGNNIESTSSILLGSGGVTISNVKVIGTIFSSNNTVDVSTKSLTFSGSAAEVQLTGSNTTIFDQSGNTTQFAWTNNGNAKFTSTYTGSTGTRTIILGTQSFSNTSLSNLTAFGTLGFSNVIRGIELNTTATDTVFANGHIFNLDLTGMNCSWNQGTMNVYGNFTVASTGGNILSSANLLTVFGANNSATTNLSAPAIVGTAGQFSCNQTILAVGMAVVITGTLTGTGTISGYSSPKTYYIIQTDGISTFTLSNTLGGSPLTTTAGTTTGLTFNISPNFRGIYGNDRELNFDISGPNTSGVTSQRVIIYSNLVLANNRTYTQVEGNLTIGNNATLTTGSFRTIACSVPTFGVLQFNANSSMNITGSNTTVWNSNRLSTISFSGTPNVYFSYNGSVGNRLLDFGSTALVSGDTNTLVNIFNFGTNTSSQFYFNPSATDTLVFVANSNINDLNMSQWTGNLSLGNTGIMYVRGNISLPITGTLVNTANINWAIVSNSLVRTFNFNNTIPNANIILTAFSSSVGGNYLFSDNINLSNTRGLYWNFGNLEFSEGINVTAQLFNNGSLTTPQRHWKTGNANITITGNSGTIVNIGNLQTVTGNIRILANNTNTGTRSFVGYTSNAGNLTPTYDFLVGTDFVNNAIVFTTSSNATTFNLGGRWRNVDLSNLYATQNNIMTVGYQVYGNYTLPVSNGVFTADTGTLTFQGQNVTQYLNFNNRTWEVPVTFNGGTNSTFIMNGNFTMGAANAAKTMNLSNGTLDLNGYQITIGTFLTGTGTKSILWNNGKIAVSNSSATAWNANVPANFTTQVGTGAGRISLFGTAAKTFVGGNINYNATLDLAGASNLTITGNNTFKDIVMTYSAANNFILFPAAGTTTVETFTGTGTSNTNRLGLVSATAGNRSTIALTGGGNVNVNFANISDINFTPMPTNGTSPMVWYVGANSLNSSNVSGALFANGGANAPIVYAIESGSAWTVPNDWNSSNNIIYLYGAGGGGGGGRGTASTNKAAGGGGGGGGFTAVANFSASPGQTIAYEVGLGGAGGTSNANGTAGGNTVWATIYTANGGGGGATTAIPTSIPGVGGVGANANGGNGGFGAFTTAAGNGLGAGGGGGSGGPNGVGGAGGNGYQSPTAANTAGGGGGGSGGGTAGTNASPTAAGTGGNNAVGFGGGAAGTVGRQGGGGGGGRNNGAAGKGGPGVDVLNSIGGGGGTGATSNLAGTNNDVIRNYGGGGAGGGVTTLTSSFVGGNGSNGAIIVVYYVGEVPVGTGFQNMFLVF